MKHVVFDIEGNGLAEVFIDRKKQVVEGCSKVHLLVLRSYTDGKTLVFRRNDEEDTIAKGWEILKRAETVIGHNIIQYDLPVLSRLYGSGDFTEDIQGRVCDTLVTARILWPDAKNHPFGGNSLEAFGRKLGCYKGDYKDGWDAWSQKMEDYGVQDTVVSQKIFDFVAPKAQRFKTSVLLEHKVSIICAGMQSNGVSINVDGAESLIDELDMERVRCNSELEKEFPPRVQTMKTPQFYEDPETGARYVTKSKAPSQVRKRLTVGPMKTRDHPFNPGSSAQIADRLNEKYGWIAPRTKPTPNCKKGNPSVGEDVLKGLKFPEAELLLRAQMAEKRLQHLTDWVKRARASRTPGRIHPQINPCGCSTSRASHQQPNQTACPKVVTRKIDGAKTVMKGYEGRYGWEMRALWGPREGWVQVGGDASGLELRMLGHCLAQYDGGAYAKVVVNGDPHTLNAEAGGLYNRDVGKTVIYAYLYGAGDEHLGEVITEHFALPIEVVQAFHEECKRWVKSKKGKTVPRGKRKGMAYSRADWLTMKGRVFRSKFENKIPALAKLTNWCQQCAGERGFVPLLDGRHAPIRSEHAALNTLLQGNGAITMKVAMVLLANQLKKKGWLWTRVAFMLWPHDEFQLECEPEIAEEVGQLIVASIVEAGKRLKLECPLDGEYKVGRSWAECH